MASTNTRPVEIRSLVDRNDIEEGMMSAKAENLAAPARPIASTVVALILALAFGAAAGSLITRAVSSDTPAVAEQVVGITPWDQQKLDAMAGRQQAETVESDGPGIAPWDQGKLDAMDGFQASVGGAGSG
jgi:hypothetical protein